MLLRNSILFLTFIICTNGVAVAQDNADSSNIHGVYKKIEEYSSTRKFTNLVKGFLLKPVIHTSQPVQASPRESRLLNHTNPMKEK